MRAFVAQVLVRGSYAELRGAVAVDVPPSTYTLPPVLAAVMWDRAVGMDRTELHVMAQAVTDVINIAVPSKVATDNLAGETQRRRFNSDLEPTGRWSRISATSFASSHSP
jgi:hypothetical protein